MGRSALVMADKGHGWAVDWFKGSTEHGEFVDTLPEFTANTAGSDVTVVVKRFEDAVYDVGTINTLHLDAEHSYQATREALSLYSPKLNKGGLLLLHDAWPNDVFSDPPWPGVYKLATELMSSRRWMYVGGVRSYAAFRKQ
jgi:hypothetical protein